MPENVKARGLSKVVEGWLAKAQPAIPQYEREAKRQEWMFREWWRSLASTASGWRR